MPDPFAKADQRTTRLLALPEIAVGGVEVARILRVVTECSSWGAYLREFRTKCTAGLANAKVACPKCIFGLRDTGQIHEDFIDTSSLVAGSVGDRCSVSTAWVDLTQGIQDFNSNDIDVGSLMMRIGYVPGRALRAQRLQALLIERTPGSDYTGPIIDFTCLTQSLSLPDYALLCGLGAVPPTLRALLAEVRKGVDGDAVRICQLPARLRRFFLESGPQLAKASERLAVLRDILKMLGLIVLHKAERASQHGVPTNFCVSRFAPQSKCFTGQCSVEGHVGYDQFKQGGALRTFDMRIDEDRAEFWETLKVICANKLTWRKPGAGATRDGKATQALRAECRNDACATASPHAPKLRSLLREVQWWSARPLTSIQKHRLLNRLPESMASTQEVVHWWADELEVRRLLLLITPLASMA